MGTGGSHLADGTPYGHGANAAFGEDQEPGYGCATCWPDFCPDDQAERHWEFYGPDGDEDNEETS